ncbi:MAG: diaminopimelate epimerase [Spartobacteria bacterium]|nr:diaminopimelate epimerase [Spartobacteria bacterium]
MQTAFWKMHGASNDFILIDDRTLTFPVEDSAWIARMATRRTGVGCEGVILIQPSETSDFRMRFFNPDGAEVEMCGNGARCVARLAHELDAAPEQMTIETVAGQLRAQVNGTQVRLWMTPPKDWHLNMMLNLKDQEHTCHAVNTGVPHAVIQVADIDEVPVQELGAAIRYHAAFAPTGTNANFMQVTGPDSLRVRTYERGVEAETLACGTGMVACGLVAGKLGLVSQPVRITPASGDLLEVAFSLTEAGADAVTLLGPAMHVFEGTIRRDAN